MPCKSGSPHGVRDAEAAPGDFIDALAVCAMLVAGFKKPSAAMSANDAPIDFRSRMRISSLRAARRQTEDPTGEDHNAN